MKMAAVTNKGNVGETLYRLRPEAGPQAGHHSVAPWRCAVKDCRGEGLGRQGAPLLPVRVAKRQEAPASLLRAWPVLDPKRARGALHYEALLGCPPGQRTMHGHP
jgi:hypothetical protein